MSLVVHFFGTQCSYIHTPKMKFWVRHCQSIIIYWFTRSITKQTRTQLLNMTTARLTEHLQRSIYDFTFLWPALRSRCGHYIFALLFLLLFSFLA